MTDRHWRSYWRGRLSSAASRHVDTRSHRHCGDERAVHAADLLTSLYDLRAAHTLASGNAGPDDLQPSGILTVHATLRTRHGEGRCLTCGRTPVGHGGDCEGLHLDDVTAFLAATTQEPS